MRIAGKAVCSVVASLMVAVPILLPGHGADRKVHACNDIVCRCPPGCIEHHGAAAAASNARSYAARHDRAMAESTGNANAERGVFSTADGVCSIRPLAAIPADPGAMRALLSAPARLPAPARAGFLATADPNGKAVAGDRPLNCAAPSRSTTAPSPTSGRGGSKSRSRDSTALP